MRFGFTGRPVPRRPMLTIQAKQTSTVKTHAVPGNQLNYIKMLQVVSKPELEPREIENAIKAGTSEIKIDLDASIGVAQWQPGETALQITERADASMYHGKESSRSS
jgi:GGDEF domain-containing protein